MNDLSEKCPEVVQRVIEKPLDKIKDKKYRDRKLVFTSFDETEPRHDFENDEIDENQAKFLIYGKEKCPETGKLHYQGFVYFYEKCSIRKAKKYLNINKGWFQYAFGNIAQNIAYCSKDGDVKQFGEVPKQGKRKDLEELKDDLMNGALIKDIVLERPMMYHQYGRTLEKIDDIKMSSKRRTEMTKGYWLYGKTGVGKTHYFTHNILKDVNELFYTWNLDEKYQCKYRHQRCVLIDDFRGELTIGQLCKLVDKWNTCEISRKCKESVSFTSEIVCITCPMRPEDLYKNVNEHDRIAQIYRRFEVIEVKRLV